MRTLAIEEINKVSGGIWDDVISSLWDHSVSACQKDEYCVGIANTSASIGMLLGFGFGYMQGGPECAPALTAAIGSMLGVCLFGVVGVGMGLTMSAINNANGSLPN